jgi:hypothetical protein
MSVEVNLMTCRGVVRSLVDQLTLSKPTRPHVPPPHVLMEMKTAVMQDRRGR